MSSGRPEIPADILDKWQRVIDLASKMANVPAGLIMSIAESCCWNSEGLSSQISLCSQRYPDANRQSSS